MEDKLEQYLEELVGIIKDAGAFAMEELPLFIQEYLTFYAWYHGSMSILFLILTIVLAWGVPYKYYYHIYVYGKWDEDDVMIFTFTSFIFGILPFIGFVYQLYHFAMVLAAPRIYLVQNLTSLI